MSRNYKRVAPDTGRMAGGFVALPWVVLDSAAWQRLSHPARSLLMELARQLGPDTNGRLSASRTYLGRRGWRSHDVIVRALRELLDGGFLHQTAQGCRPNKASWFALTWQRLCTDKTGFDPGTAESFRRGVFADGEPLPLPKPTREELYRRWDKNASLSPSGGLEGVPIGPSHGLGASVAGPSGGPIGPTLATPPSPSHGHHLDIAIYRSEATVPESIVDGGRAARPARRGRPPAPNSVTAAIIRELLTGPKTSTELTNTLGLKASAYIHATMRMDGVLYRVQSERIGRACRYTLVAPRG